MCYDPRPNWIKREWTGFEEMIRLVDSKLDAICKDCEIVCRERERTNICGVISRWTIETENPHTPAQQTRLRKTLERIVKRKRYRLDVSFIDSRSIRLEVIPEAFYQIIGHFLRIRKFTAAGYDIVPTVNYVLMMMCLPAPEGQPLSIRDDRRRPVEQYISLAEYEYVEVQMQLAYDYQHGLRHLNCDKTEAVKWYRKAAEQGCTEGQYQLALCYERGYGVAQDYTKAAQWYLLAAKQGHLGSCRKLAVYYCRGYGVKQSKNEIEKYRKRGRFILVLRKIGLKKTFSWPYLIEAEIEANLI